MPRLILLFTLILISIPAMAKTPDQVRSAFLFQMAKFIEFNNPIDDEGIRFCFYRLDQGPGKILFSNNSLEINGNNIKVLELEKTASLEELSSQCNITYIDEKMENDILPVWLKDIPHQTMVVGETLSFLEQGGTAALIQEGKRIRLYINKQQLTKSLYKVQSRLMTVAKFYPN